MFVLSRGESGGSGGRRGGGHPGHAPQRHMRGATYILASPKAKVIVGSLKLRKGLLEATVGEMEVGEG